MTIGPAENVPFEDESAKCVLLSTILRLREGPAEGHERGVPGPFPPAAISFCRTCRRKGPTPCCTTWRPSRGKYNPETAPAHPYPIEFVEEGTWVSTDEVVSLIGNAGFVDLEFVQTLTRHPKYTNDSVEQPIPGYDKGDFVVVRARKPQRKRPFPALKEVSPGRAARGTAPRGPRR